MDECVYFTRRTVGTGKVMAWVFRGDCPKCKQSLMQKPTDEKTGSVKIRAKEYVCPKCKHVEEAKSFEETLTLNAQYLCPHCKKSGESTGLYKRKSYQGVKEFVVECNDCHQMIPITKKLKEIKKKGEPSEVVDDE